MATRAVLAPSERTKIVFGRGSASDPARGAHDAPPDPRLERGIPPPHTQPPFGASILGPYRHFFLSTSSPENNDCLKAVS